MQFLINSFNVYTTVDRLFSKKSDFPPDTREEYDTTGKTTYKDACRQFGVIPVSYFLRHMQDTELIMRHHGLGPAGTKAIAVSLVVSLHKILSSDSNHRTEFKDLRFLALVFDFSKPRKNHFN